MATAIDGSLAELTEGVDELSISIQTRQRLAELPEKYQDFLLSDRIFFASMSRTELVKLLEGKSAQQLEKILQELIWLDSKLSVRTAADTDQIDQQNLEQINNSLDSFIAD